MTAVRKQIDTGTLVGMDIAVRNAADNLIQIVAQRITARIGLIWPQAAALRISPNPGTGRNEIIAVLDQDGEIVDQYNGNPWGTTLLQGIDRSKHALYLTEDVHLLTALCPYGHEGLIEPNGRKPGRYIITLAKESWV